jgi:hypothetical protein
VVELGKAYSQLTKLGPRLYYRSERAKAAYKKTHGKCEITGWPVVRIHHKKSVHTHPHLADDPTNFIALGFDVDLHQLIGHLDDFRDINPNVDADARILSLIFAKILRQDGPAPVVMP